MKKKIEFNKYIRGYKERFDIGKALRAEDWYLFQDIVRDYSVKSVLEFGCGLSTLLWQALDLSTVSLETDKKFMSDVAEICSGNIKFPNVLKRFLMFSTWNNTDTIDNPGSFALARFSFDMAFVDGIDPRDKQIKIASQLAPVVIVHDGYSRPTPPFIDKYLSNWQEIEVDSLRSRLFLKRG